MVSNYKRLFVKIIHKSYKEANMIKYFIIIKLLLVGSLVLEIVVS